MSDDVRLIDGRRVRLDDVVALAQFVERGDLTKGEARRALEDLRAESEPAS
jgi:polyhydroxyalkanoate synthesis regulator phasin